MTLAEIGDPPPSALAPARVQLHWAIQIPAAAARAMVRPEPDDSHTSFEWLGDRPVLAGVRVPSGLRAALRLPDLNLLVLGDDDMPAAEKPLAGHTLDEGMQWMKEALGAPGDAKLARPSHDMPDHPVGHGACFSDVGVLASRTELTRWYAAADGMLRARALATPGASSVRCWPHHFDIATLLPASGAAGPTAAPSTVGIGLSPGDGSYAEPYFYVTAWPRPTGPSLPPLPAGARWHREGWFGAVLTGTALVAVEASARADCLAQFVDTAMRACRL